MGEDIEIDRDQRDLIGRIVGERAVVRPFKLTPGRKCRSPERVLHFDVAKFLRLAMPAGVLWSHFPAGEKRDDRTASKLKRMGLNPGWPDFVFVLSGGQAAFIELKAPKGNANTAQKAFREAVDALGGLYAECRSVEAVELALRAWNVELRGRISA